MVFGGIKVRSKGVGAHLLNKGCLLLAVLAVAVMQPLPTVYAQTLVRTISTSLTMAVEWDQANDVNILTTGPNDDDVHVVDSTDGSTVRTITSSAVGEDMSLSLDGVYVAVPSSSTLRVYTVATGASFFTASVGETIRSVHFNPTLTGANSQVAVVGSSSGSIKIYDTTGSLVDTIATGHTENTIYQVRYSPDATKIATAASDDTFRVFQTSDGSALHTFTASGGNAHAISWSPDGNYLAGGRGGGGGSHGMMWSVSTGDLIYTFTEPTFVVRGVEWSPNGKLLVFACEDSYGYVYDVSTPTAPVFLSAVSDPSSILWDVAFKSDSSQFALAGTQGVVFVYDSPILNIDITVTVSVRSPVGTDASTMSAALLAQISSVYPTATSVTQTTSSLTAAGLTTQFTVTNVPGDSVSGASCSDFTPFCTSSDMSSLVCQPDSALLVMRIESGVSTNVCGRYPVVSTGSASLTITVSEV